MMAPVHPKPTNTASTGLSVVVTALSLHPTRTAFETHRRIGDTLAVPGHPFLVVIVGAGESDHLPGAHILIAAVDGIGEVAFLGVLQKHREESLTVDAAIQFDLAALQPLQHLVLVVCAELVEYRAVEIGSAVFVDCRNGSAIQVGRIKAALIALFRCALGPWAAQVVVITA